MSTLGRLGLDPDQMDELAVRMSQAAEALQSIRDSILAKLNTTHWEGEDGDQFRLEWNHRHSASLVSTVGMLHESARVVRVQAAQQRGVSEVDTGPRSHFSSTVTVDGTTPWDVAGFGVSGGIDILNLHPNLKFLGPIANRLSALEILSDIGDGLRNGWDDERIGAVTLDVVSIGLGMGGEAMFNSGVVALATGVGAPVAVLLLGGGAALTVASIGVSALSDFVPGVDAAVGGFMRGVGEGAVQMWNAGGDFIDGTVDAFKGALEPAGAVLSVAGNAIGTAAEATEGFISKLNPFD